VHAVSKGMTTYAMRAHGSFLVFINDGIEEQKVHYV
jgi:hypothetical protein